MILTGAVSSLDADNQPYEIMPYGEHVPRGHRTARGLPRFLACETRASALNCFAPPPRSHRDLSKNVFPGSRGARSPPNRADVSACPRGEVKLMTKLLRVLGFESLPDPFADSVDQLTAMGGSTQRPATHAGARGKAGGKGFVFGRAINLFVIQASGIRSRLFHLERKNVCTSYF